MREALAKQNYWLLSATILLTLAGVLLWWCNLIPGRGLFLDEANLALNLSEKSFAELFKNLDYQQYAPPLFLVLAKTLAVCFDYSEITLRILPFSGGLLTIWGLWLSGRQLQLQYWVLLPIALLFTNPLVLHYVTEFKQYATDMGLAALFIYGFCRSPLPRWWWAPLGAVYCWLSMPAIFVLTAIGCYTFFAQVNRGRNQFKWLLIGAVWAFSFLAYYILILRVDASKSGLVGYHSPYFLPLRWWEAAEFLRGLALISAIFKQVAGYTILAILMGIGFTALGVVSFVQAKDRRWMLLLLPLVFALLASGLRLYSLIPRMMLFTLPGLLLLIGKGSYWLVAYGQKKRFKPAFYGTLLAWIIVLGSTNIVRHYRSPLIISELREALHSLQPKPTYVHPFAVPGVRYYLEVHPQRGLFKPDDFYLDTAKVGLQPLNDHLEINAIYDHLSSKIFREDMHGDSIELTRAGYRVKQQLFFRSAILECNLVKE